MSTKTQTFYYLIWRFVASLWLAYSTAGNCLKYLQQHVMETFGRRCDGATFLKEVQKLAKRPTHVALAFQDASVGTLPLDLDNHNLDYNPLHVKKIADITAWIASTGVNSITLYNENGALKYLQSTLRSEIANSLDNFVSQISSQPIMTSRTEIVIHSAAPGQNCVTVNASEHESFDELYLTRRINVFICSRDDGKPKLLDMLTKSGTSVHFNLENNNNNNNNSGHEYRSHIDVNAVNEYLTPKCCPYMEKTGYKLEPDLLISFGETQSTCGFLPWHVRLTELHWLPHVNRVSIRQVLGVLRKYSKCEQRLGK